MKIAFDLNESIGILKRTPKVLTEMLSGLPNEWILNNEGGETWSPYDVVGHLIHGEKTDWIPRLKIILEYGTDKPFEPFDRFIQLTDSNKKSLVLLLEEFTRLRQNNLRFLKTLSLDENALNLKGIHPEFGSVTVRELIAAWTAHDLGHIVQISRVMAKQYTKEVGPWTKYLKVLS